MARPVVHAHPAIRVTMVVALAALIGAACGETPGTARVSPPASAARATPTPTVTPTLAPPAPTPLPSTARPPSPAPSATPRPPVAVTPATFWAAAARGLTTAARLQVTATGPNPAILRFEPGASATIVDGQIAFVCLGRAAYDGQSGFSQVAGTWTCGTGALTAGFRFIGQPVDGWSKDSPTDTSIKEAVTATPDGTWTWAYASTSAFLGGRVTATLRLDPARGRILAGRRVDPTGVTTYRFVYGAAFPPLAVPAADAAPDLAAG